MVGTSTSAVFGQIIGSMNDYQHGERPWAAPDPAPRVASTLALLEQLHQPSTRLRDGIGSFSATAARSTDDDDMDASQDQP